MISQNSDQSDDADVIAESLRQPDVLFHVLRPVAGDPIQCTWCLCVDADLNVDHECVGECPRTAVREAKLIWAGKQFPEPIAVCAEHLPALRAYVDSLPNRDHGNLG